MNFSKKQIKLFSRIHNKHTVSLEFLIKNFGKVVRLYKYIKSFHFIIKRRFKIRKNRAIIAFNEIRKKFLGNPLSFSKKTLSWTKRLILKRKQQRIQELSKIQIQKEQLDNEENRNEIVKEKPSTIELSADEVQKQLKEQLELLKMGKSSRPPQLVDKKNSIIERRRNTFNFHNSNETYNLLSNANNSKETIQEFSSIIKKLPERSNSIETISPITTTAAAAATTTILISTEAVTTDCISKVQKQTFLDSLINRFTTTNQTNHEKYDNFKSNKNNSNIFVDSLSDYENSTGSSDFLGFTDSDIISGTIPGMLPTPIVSKDINNMKSAFVSEDLENFMRENSLENSANIILPPKIRKLHEEGLVYDGSQPPKMIQPERPKDLIKTRTVAEKRSILKKRKNIKYWMIENENTIYHELKKRSKHGKTINTNLIKYIQNSKVPFTRDCWKASTWLCTRNGNFYFQNIKIDSKEYKIIGGSGNHPQKYMKEQSSKPNSYEYDTINCELLNCRQNKDFKNIRINNPELLLLNTKSKVPELKLKLNSPSIKSNNIINSTNKNLKIEHYKPGPLSKKIKINFSNYDHINADQLAVYNMPQIQLEVYPKLDKPLDENVKSYLKMILPSENISREWAEFSVSTLLVKNSKNTINDTKHKSFTFNVPYLNGQNSLLVRKLFKKNEKFDERNRKNYEFYRNMKKSNTNEQDFECATILADMIDSVSLSLSEDYFIKSDPDINYKNNNKINTIINERDKIKPKIITKKRTAKEKLVSELKRLNATVIDADNLYLSNNKTNCTEEFCKLGCICNSINSLAITRKHCKKPNCMFQCTCKHNETFNNDMNQTISEEDAFLIREKATAKLAKVEKEFCSTIVLTDNKTILINDTTSYCDRKRNKKLPKRYDDFINNENEHFDNKSTSITTPTVLANKNQEIVSVENVQNENFLKNLQHCTVNLMNLQNLDNIEPWCMIHCLYKCFCNLQSVHGEVYEIKKYETIIEEEIVYTRKRRYSFDRNDDIDETPTNKQQKTTANDTNSTATNVLGIKNEKLQYLQSPTISSCSRICKIPAKYYHHNNWNRLAKHAKFLKIEEIALIDFLNKHNIQCLSQISKRNLNRMNIQEILPSNKQILIKNMNMNIAEKNSAHETSHKHQKHVITSEKHLIEENRMIQNQFIEQQNNNNPRSLLLKNNSNLQTNSGGVLFKFSSTENLIEKNQELNNDSQTNSKPIITSVRSLNNMINETTDITSTSLNVSDDQLVIGTEEFHRKAIKKLNLAVTKTMHSICNIQKKNTKRIPAPVANTLCSHQWKYFLQAYCEGFIFIWEIKVNNTSIIAATIRNIMPIIPNALSVINIKAIRWENLPLLCKMLNGQIQNDKTKTLSVLMTGFYHYWRIIGFINSSYDYLQEGCIVKPTPTTHPRLSLKINTLYKMLILHEFNTKRNIEIRQDRTGFKKHKRTTQHNNNNNNENNYGIPINQMPNSNIEIKRVTPIELDSIFVPIPVKGNHRWLMLTLYNDFSHIYIPDWQQFLSYDKIQKAIKLATHTNKTVRLGHGLMKIDVYATPGHLNRIYFGPFEYQKQLDIILYQNIDGQMMLRQDFELSQNISRTECTTGCWLYMKNDQLVLEQKNQQKPTDFIVNNEINTNITNNTDNNNDHDDDECLIIEDDYLNVNNVISNTKDSEKNVLNKDKSNLFKHLSKTSLKSMKQIIDETVTQRILDSHDDKNRKSVLIPKKILLKQRNPIEIQNMSKIGTINKNHSLDNGQEVIQQTNETTRFTQIVVNNEPKIAALSTKFPSDLIVTCEENEKQQRQPKNQFPFTKIDKTSTITSSSLKINHLNNNRLNPSSPFINLEQVKSTSAQLPNHSETKLSNSTTLSSDQKSSPPPKIPSVSKLNTISSKSPTFNFDKQSLTSILNSNFKNKSSSPLLKACLDKNMPMAKLENKLSSHCSKSNLKLSTASSILKLNLDKKTLSSNPEHKLPKNLTISTLSPDKQSSMNTFISNLNLENKTSTSSISSTIRSSSASKSSTNISSTSKLSFDRQSPSSISKLNLDNKASTSSSSSILRSIYDNPSTLPSSSALKTNINTSPNLKLSFDSHLPSSSSISKVNLDNKASTSSSILKSIYDKLSSKTPSPNFTIPDNIQSNHTSNKNLSENVIPSTSSSSSSSSSSPNSTMVRIISSENKYDISTQKAIRGHVISNYIQLGKIPAYKLEDGYALKMPNFKGTVKLRTMCMVDKYISEYLRIHIKEFVPKNLYIAWHFVELGKEGNKHKLHDRNILRKDKIITKDGIYHFFESKNQKSQPSTTKTLVTAQNDKEDILTLGKLSSPTVDSSHIKEIKSIKEKNKIKEKIINTNESIDEEESQEQRKLNTSFNNLAQTNLFNSSSVNNPSLRIVHVLKKPSSTHPQSSHESKKLRPTSSDFPSDVILIEDD